MIEKWFHANEGLVQVVALAFAYFSIIKPIVNYLSIQRKINRDNRFKAYHLLIDEFSGSTPKLDRQITIVFELRRFPEYFPVTKRILSKWVRTEDLSHKGLYDEIDLTKKFIEYNFLKRFYLSYMISKGFFSNQ